MKPQVLKSAACALILGVLAMWQTASAQQKIDIVFVDHLTAGLIEQDVFVEKEPGSGLIYRVLPGEQDKYLDAPVYKSTIPHKHDPFNAVNAGPCAKGEPLGMTLREWLGGRGTATYVCDDGWGKFEAEFTGLVPNATYTMWHFFMAKNSTTPFTGTLDLPIGNRDGSQSVFRTDARGNATMKITFDQCLQLGDTQLASGVAIAYHSDGKTYGVLPGDFGTVTHVQLFALLPDVEAPKRVGDD
ncbi:MAG: hypothetical protein R3301_13615 [Saprospiraceae bacterium]|nr:hypothetical protein [Saprospiraceae bacterium]